MGSFTCLSLSPISVGSLGVALATSQAGGVGCLDLEFAPDPSWAASLLTRFWGELKPGERGGVRLWAEQIPAYHPWISEIRPHWLILSHWDLDTLELSLEMLGNCPGRTLLLEVLDSRVTLPDQLPIQGVVGRGHESGGWVSNDSAFILTQKLLAAGTYPVYVQGGMGVFTAAACRGAGAAGVVLDDCLWLMPETNLSQDWQHHLERLSGQEATVLGERLAPCRVLVRPGLAAAARLERLADQIEVDTEGTGVDRWRREAQPWLGWQDPQQTAWPLGQAVGLAATYRDIYQTTGRLVRALLRNSQDLTSVAHHHAPLAPHSPLALSHRTTYPIVQGPMTRVSDTAEFAQAVAQGGGLPLLALALMPGPQVRQLLAKTQALLGGLSWGVGMLGFADPGLREQQLEAVLAAHPPFALIAGGRPDQAAHLERQGIATYIHVPVPQLLRMFFAQGARRFVFEGRECGGHIGPLSSFVLWESMITTLLEIVPPEAAPEVHILFAGGIHDRLSAGLVGVLGAPLAARGMKIGVLMGTAYLFTREAVACGAIQPGFQAQALACRETVNLETGPGHASRCVDTPFAREFYRTRRQLIAQGRSAEEVKNALEELNLGRLRIAAKGLNRNSRGEIIPVSPQDQLTEGMYMIGQVATLPHQAGSIADLHVLVCDQEVAPPVSNSPRPADVAIIGMATLVPQADSPSQFWQNILQQVNGLTEIPAHRWDWHLYYDPDRNRRDHIYSKWGGFLPETPFDPARFGIPPRSLPSIEPVQLLTLEVVRRALEDAGYGTRDFDREQTSVILGAGGGIGDLGGLYATRSALPSVVADPDPLAWDRLPEWTEESFPGLLPNVAAGRVANRFNLGGRNFTVDAACASSLAAIDLAVQELETGRSNLVIAGGIDTGQSPFAYFCFSKTQALSPQGQPRPFDKNADGITISEGIAILVLKRLSEAERDGDRIYGVIKAVAGSSDGRALGMTAPLPAGQQRALQRVYAKAGYSPHTLGLYEAHGTGTVAGDRAELETVCHTLAGAPPQTCLIGSVKSLVGHTKSAAGVVGLTKAVLALHHQVLPPHYGVEEPLDPCTDPTSPVYLLREPRPWLAPPGHPRRAGVSAFGFGGTNFHVALEEYPQAALPGAQAWPWELVLLSGQDQVDLKGQVQRLGAQLQAGATPDLADLAYTLALVPPGPARVALVVSTLAQLQTTLTALEAHLADPVRSPLPPEVRLNLQPLAPGKVAFLFPGQGSQYPAMVRELALYCGEVRRALELADRELGPELPRPLSQYVYPPASFTQQQERYHQQELTQTQIAQPAIAAVEMGLLDLATRLGMSPDLLVGHSLGEYAALYAAGVLAGPDLLRLVRARSLSMASAGAQVPGMMAAVQVSRDQLMTMLEPGVVLANHNAPLQSVVSGPLDLVTRLVEKWQSLGINARLLPVSGAFHSPLMAGALPELTAAIAETKFTTPRLPVYANATAVPYPPDPASIQAHLLEHLTGPVAFVDQVEALYQAGARVFVELGPKAILTKLVGQILAQRPHTAVAFEGQGEGWRGFLGTLGTLFILGVVWDPPALFMGRRRRRLDLARLVDLTRPSPLTPTTYMVSGAAVRSPQAPSASLGQRPLLTQAQPLKAPLPSAQLSPMDYSPVSISPPTSSNGSPEVLLALYQAYQAAMGQFLHNQERVTGQFLRALTSSPNDHRSANLPAPAYQNGALPPAVPTPMAAPVAPPVVAASIPAPVAPPVVAAPIPAPVAPPVVADSIPAPVAPPVVAAPAPPDTLDRPTLVQILVNLVSDRTGYPPDMLGLDQDLEADLGIDSIKRVEILGALQKALPTGLRGSVQQDMEQFTRVKTLNVLVDQILQLVTPDTPRLGKP